MLNLCLKQKHKKRFFIYFVANGPHCMVMCRPTYISGPARNGSIPPITMTDRRGQGCTMFHMYAENLFRQQFLHHLYHFQSFRVIDYSICRQSPWQIVCLTWTWNYALKFKSCQKYGTLEPISLKYGKYGVNFIQIWHQFQCRIVSEEKIYFNRNLQECARNLF